MTSPSLLLALLPVLASAAPEFELPSRKLRIEEGCHPSAFMPGFDRVIHYCEGELVITDLATGNEAKRFAAGGGGGALVVVTPDGSRIGLALNGGSDARIWDLFVLDAESGKVLLREMKFAKVDDTPEGLQKLLKKLRKVDELEGAQSNAILVNPKDRDTFIKPLAAPNGLTVEWRDGERCGVRVSRDGELLSESAVRPNGRSVCTGLVASADGRHIVYGAMAYSTELDKGAIQDVADRTKAADLVSQGRGAMKSGRPDIALKDFEQAVALDPKLGNAYMYRGLTHLKLEHAREAAADLKQAVALLDERHRKDLEEVRGRAEALGGVQDALRKNPDDTAALRHRILFRISNEDFHGCSIDYSRAKALKAALSALETEAGTKCVAESRRRSEVEMQERQAKADASAREYMRQADANRSSSWWADVDLGGMARAINAGTNAVGNSSSGGSSGSGSSYRASSSYGSSASGSSSSGPSSADRDQALVNKSIEKKLWDMNNPNNRR